MVRQKPVPERRGVSDGVCRGGRRCVECGDDDQSLPSPRCIQYGAIVKKRARNRHVRQSAQAMRQMILEQLHVPVPLTDSADDTESSITKGPQEQGFPGGPRVKDLLVDYPTHISGLIWSGEKVDKILKVHRRGKWISYWDERVPLEPIPWMTVAQRSGLTSLRDLHWDHVDHVLISAFVERWYPETNTFHFPWGEMTITLHDVACLLGLAIDGEALAFTWQDADLRSNMTDIFGWNAQELQKYYKEGGISLEDLNKKLVDMIAEQRPAEHVASGFLMNILGCTIFVDKSTQRVKHPLAGLLLDHERTGTYAWGVGVLANLYRSLGESSRSGGAQLDGCTLLLERWIWMYFPVFRGHLEVDPRRRADMRYAVKYHSLGTPKKKKERLAKFRQQLDTFRVEDVEWMPFGKDLDFEGHYRVSTYRGTIQFLGEEEPYMPDRVVRQYGKVQGRPENVIKPYDKKRNAKIKPYEVRFLTEHNHWATRYEHLYPILQLPSVQLPWDVKDDYFDWFLPRTHPYMLPTSTPQPPPAHLPLDLAQRAQIFVQEIRAYALRGEAVPVDVQLHLLREFDGPDAQLLE